MLLVALCCLLHVTGVFGDDYSKLPSPEFNVMKLFSLPIGQGEANIVQCPLTPRNEGCQYINIIDFGVYANPTGKFNLETLTDWLTDLETPICKVNGINVFITHPHNDHEDWLVNLWGIIDPGYTNINAQLQSVYIGGTRQNYSSGNVGTWFTHMC